MSYTHKGHQAIQKLISKEIVMRNKSLATCEIVDFDDDTETFLIPLYGGISAYVTFGYCGKIWECFFLAKKNLATIHPEGEHVDAFKAKLSHLYKSL